MNGINPMYNCPIEVEIYFSKETHDLVQILRNRIATRLAKFESRVVDDKATEEVKAEMIKEIEIFMSEIRNGILT